MGDGIARAMTGAVAALAVAVALATAALIFGLPWLWGLLKPWLHAVTA